MSLFDYTTNELMNRERMAQIRAAAESRAASSTASRRGLRGRVERPSTSRARRSGHATLWSASA